MSEIKHFDYDPTYETWSVEPIRSKEKRYFAVTTRSDEHALSNLAHFGVDGIVRDYISGDVLCDEDVLFNLDIARKLKESNLQIVGASMIYSPEKPHIKHQFVVHAIELPR